MNKINEKYSDYYGNLKFKACTQVQILKFKIHWLINDVVVIFF